jgi:hypothetical protein
MDCVEREIIDSDGICPLAARFQYYVWTLALFCSLRAFPGFCREIRLQYSEGCSIFRGSEKLQPQSMK